MALSNRNVGEDASAGVPERGELGRGVGRGRHEEALRRHSRPEADASLGGADLLRAGPPLRGLSSAWAHALWSRRLLGSSRGVGARKTMKSMKTAAVLNSWLHVCASSRGMQWKEALWCGMLIEMQQLQHEWWNGAGKMDVAQQACVEMSQPSSKSSLISEGR